MRGRRQRQMCIRASKKPMGLRLSMDHASHATHIHTSWWIAWSMPLRARYRRDSRHIRIPRFRILRHHVSYNENAGLGMTAIGSWLGISHIVGELMSCWMLTKSGTVISCTTVQRATNPEKETEEIKASHQERNAGITRR